MLQFTALWNMPVDVFMLFYRVCLFIKYHHPDKMYNLFASYNQAEILKDLKWQLHSMIESFFFTIWEIRSSHSHWVCTLEFIISFQWSSGCCQLLLSYMLYPCLYRWNTGSPPLSHLQSFQRRRKKTTLPGNLWLWMKLWKLLSGFLSHIYYQLSLTLESKPIRYQN